MNCDTGEIKRSDKGFQPPWVAIDEQEVPKVRRMNKNKRKAWMRNKPCVCGSGRKFKKCCWHKYANAEHCPEVSRG